MQDPTGRVYRLAIGRAARAPARHLSRVPNGIVFNAAGTHLYVALTRACQVWRVPVTRDAVVGKANVFAQLPAGVSGPDGLAIERRGRPCHRRSGPRLCLAARPSRRPRPGSCPAPAARSPTSPTKGSISLIPPTSETGQILKARAPVPGQPLSTYMTRERQHERDLGPGPLRGLVGDLDHRDAARA